MQNPQNFQGAAPPDPRHSSLGGAPRQLACAHRSSHGLNINWSNIMARQFFLATLSFRIQYCMQFKLFYSLQSTGMLISKRTKLNVQRGQAQCSDGLNAFKRNAQRGHYQCSRGQTQYPEGTNNAQRGQTQSPEAERPNSMPRRAKLNAQIGQT